MGEKNKMNTIIDLPASEFSPEELIDHLHKNRPCVVRGFLKPDVVQQYLEHINSANLKKYFIGNLPASYMEKTDLASNSYLDAYQSEPCLVHSNILRVWKHNAKNLTRWHYDGNGADLLNISLQGKKRFYLAPPNSLPVYPLTNIAWKYDFQDTHQVEIQPGDMLFLPAYWFHKVLTLEDNTININYMMYNKNNPEKSSSRDRELFGLHRMFGTTMDKEILDIHHEHPDKPNTISCLARGLYECFLFIAIFIIIYAFAKTKKIWWLIMFLLLTGLIIGLYLYTNESLGYDTNGISILIGFYILVITLLFMVFEWNQNQEAYHIL